MPAGLDGLAEHVARLAVGFQRRQFRAVCHDFLIAPTPATDVRLHHGAREPVVPAPSPGPRTCRVNTRLVSLAGYLQIPGGELLAGLIAAVVAAVMIVVGNRSIEAVVESVAATMVAGARARRRGEEIERICDEAIPLLVKDRMRLAALLDSHFSDRAALIDSTLEGLTSNRDFAGFMDELRKVNEAYGAALPWQTFEEFDEFMLDDSRPPRRPASDLTPSQSTVATLQHLLARLGRASVQQLHVDYRGVVFVFRLASSEKRWPGLDQRR